MPLARASRGSNTLIQIESNSVKSLGWLLVLAATILITMGYAIATLTWMSFEYSRMEREFRLYQYKLDNQNALLIRAGIMEPDDLYLDATDSDNPAGSELSTQKEPEE